jgi:predicted Zn-dependent protease
MSLWRYAGVGIALAAGAQQRLGINFYSVDQEIAMGAAQARETAAKTIPLNNAAASAYVDRVTRELAAQIPDSQFQYVATVVKDDLGVEPAALPGGYIFVSSSQFTTTQSESEFVGLLARAVAHVADRDATRIATRGELMRIAMEPPRQSGGPAGNAAPGNGLFRRGFDRQADWLAVKMMAAAGYDPVALLHDVERIPADGFPGWQNFRKERLAELRKEAAAATVAASGDGAEFARVREMVAK